MSEFNLIARYFKHPDLHHADVVLGVGDDCALLRPSSLLQAISTDMLVEGQHFFADAEPYLLGHKCLAVNLSDLAAMGARPTAFTLALSLPGVDHTWLQKFSDGMLHLARQHDCALIGGDTTRGPRTICITVIGEVAASRALRRDAAQVDDDIWVSGTLGDARIALACRRGVMTLDPKLLAVAEQRMDAPSPRVALGLALAGIAHAAIDLSDGLAGDLAHILTRSNVGATINLETLPAGLSLQALAVTQRWDFCAAGGDDYELCFTAPVNRRDAVLAASKAKGTPVTRIGKIETQLGLRWHDEHGAHPSLSFSSFDHFMAP